MTFTDRLAGIQTDLNSYRSFMEIPRNWLTAWENRDEQDLSLWKKVAIYATTMFASLVFFVAIGPSGLGMYGIAKGGDYGDQGHMAEWAGQILLYLAIAGVLQWRVRADGIYTRVQRLFAQHIGEGDLSAEENKHLIHWRYDELRDWESGGLLGKPSLEPPRPLNLMEEV